MLPFPFAGGDPVRVSDPSDPSTKWSTPSLLHAIANSSRPSLCGNAAVRILVQHKWQNFGRNLFLKELGLYCCGLLLLLILLFVRVDPFRELTATELLSEDIQAQSSFVVTVVVLLESLFTLSRECRKISVLGLKHYFREDWKNSVDVVVILLT